MVVYLHIKIQAYIINLTMDFLVYWWIINIFFSLLLLLNGLILLLKVSPYLLLLPLIQNQHQFTIHHQKHENITFILFILSIQSQTVLSFLLCFLTYLPIFFNLLFIFIFYLIHLDLHLHNLLYEHHYFNWYFFLNQVTLYYFH